MQYLSTFLLCATVATAAPHGMSSVNPLIHRSPNTNSGLARMSSGDIDAIVKTCWSGKLAWPLPDTPAPCADNPPQQLDLFPKPDAKPQTLTVNNHCDYDIHYTHLGMAGANLGQGVLAKKSSLDHPLKGTVFKASKSPSGAQDVLVEYSVAGDGKVWYDMSLITCLGQTNGLPNADTSACAGHDGGLQLGNQAGMAFQCGAGVWCDDQAYLYQENLCKKQNPVSQADANLGLTMEFCAQNK